MRSRKRIFWISGLIGFIALFFARVLIFQASNNAKSIVLPNGLEISLVAVTAGTNPIPDPSLLNRIFLNRVRQRFPSSRPLFRKLGFKEDERILSVIPMLSPFPNRNASEDDFTFWISVKSSDGSNATLNEFDIEFRAEESNEFLNIDRVTKVDPKNGRAFSAFHIPKLRDQTSRVNLVLRYYNDQGNSKEITTWKIDVP